MSPSVPSRNDRAALIIAIIIGVGVVGYSLIDAITRIVVIVGNTNVPVTAAFDTAATLPLGPDGSAIDVIASQAVVYASDMAGITVVSLVLAEIVYAIAVSVTVLCASFALRNIIRGRAFSTANVGLIGVATLTVAFGWMLNWLFTTMGANGALAALGAPGANAPFAVEPVMIFAIAALGGLSTAFVVGHRLENETKGLV
jgi:hypothetical protein